MNIINMSSWEEWEETFNKLIHNIDFKKKEDKYSTYSDVLFRGHSCESWVLKTTLERYLNKKVSMLEYNRYLQTVKPAFSAFTEKNWNLTHEPKIDDMPSSPPGYELMVYLRHHGFPTPLLDWSLSPYIASFFAFQNAGEEENVAVYTFIEYYGGGKSGCVGSPTIHACGPYIESHKRHFNQQGQYTICREKLDDRWFYCNHNEVFKREDKDQDVVTKYLIPSIEKHKALKQLDIMNINSFSLYGSTESLAEMLAYREIMKRNL